VCKVSLRSALSVPPAGRRAFPLQRRLCSGIASVVVGVVIEIVTAPARVFEMSQFAFPVLDQSWTLAIACTYVALLPSYSKVPAANAL
jgi:hypothetical protein